MSDRRRQMGVVLPTVVRIRRSAERPICLPKSGIEPFTGTEPVDAKRVAVHGIVHSHAPVGREPQPPESR